MFIFDIQQRDFKAFFLQLFQGVQNGMMLKSGGNNVLFSLPGAVSGSGDDGLIVGLTATGGEVNFPGLAAQDSSDTGAAVFQHFLGLLTNGVQGRGVAIEFLTAVDHRLQRRFAYFGSWVCLFW